MRIPLLEDVPIVWRIVFGLVVVLVVLALLMVLERSEATGETVSSPVWSKWDDHIDELERQALDEAFKKYIGNLYSIWVTDNYQPRIPPKALTGARNARDAYVRAMEAVEKREWPPRAK